MSLKEFEILTKLGEGAYSSVYKVRRIADSQIYALKKVKLGGLEGKEQENALNQVRILASIHSPYIIGYKQAFIENGALCIVMDYSDDGDLYQKIVSHQKNATTFSEETVWKTLIMVVGGLCTLHKMNILHRDLKSANVFLSSDGTARLGDMNVSKLAKEGLLYTQTGTPYYASPEVWKDKPYDHKSDIWSLGCVIYEMVALKPPFRAEDMDGLYKKVIKGSYSKIGEHYSKLLSSTIKSMLQVNPSSRPSAPQLLHNLEGKMEELRMQVASPVQMELMKTIHVNKNLHYMTDRLPKSNYSNVSQPQRHAQRQADKQSKHIHSSKTKQSVEADSHTSDPHTSDPHTSDPHTINLPKLDRIIRNSTKKADHQRKKPVYSQISSLQNILKIEGNVYGSGKIRYDEGYEREKKDLDKDIKAELRRIYNMKPSPKKHLRRPMGLPSLH